MEDEMKHVWVAIASLAIGGGLLWNGPAAAQSTSQAPQTPSGAPAISTEEYVNRAAQGDMLEIQAGQLAAKQAQQQDVKQFAEMMIKDHTQTSDELKAALQSANIKATPPTSLDKEHQAKLDQLRKAEGKQFDQAYMKQQVELHQQAQQLHENYVLNGKDQALKPVAQKIVLVVHKHLQLATNLEKSLQPAPSDQGAEREKR
jgi:putative membrane protein